jgi:predicted metalloprotease with PDZ domain
MARPMNFAIAHRLAICAPQSHLLEVETLLTGDLPREIVLFMPVWAPGSYLVREYARHVEGLAAEAPARTTKVRKNAWRLQTMGLERVVVRYRVYANELTVRTSHVDETHAFLVGAGIFLGVEGYLDARIRVEIQAPAAWRVATSLERLEAPPVQLAPEHVRSIVLQAPVQLAPEHVRSIVLQAPNFDTLVDSPIELGTHREERFVVLGVPHRYSIWPADGVPERRITKLLEDTAAIVEREASLFGGTLPYDAYELLLHISPRARGGLEHAASAALIATPASFASRSGYLEVLSLVAHEVFHAWNIKRIRPAGLSPYRYDEECYTRLLWWFEGATSYYDWRVLALAGICTIEEYLEHLAGEIAYLDATPGRLVQALEDTSFDAWIKLYRPDENSTNSTVSYYRKGEVVCALLDLEIRSRSQGRTELDTVLAHLWREYGQQQRPVPEDAMQAVFERASGVALGDLFDAWIRSPGEIDPTAALAHVGLALERSSHTDAPPCSLGMRTRTEGRRTIVASVTREAAAARAGITAGDELLGIGGMRVENANVEATLRGFARGEGVDVVLSRDGRILTRRANLDAARTDVVKLVARRDASPAARDAFEGWLGMTHPVWGLDAP